MRSRRKAREAALQALYQCDTINDWSEQSVDFYFQIFQAEVLKELTGLVKENHDFSRSIIRGVCQHLNFLDQQISTASTRWSLNRMSRVDRNILRLSSFEMAFLKDIPVNVSINEAIEIAKRYGTDDSPMFINGVLDNLASVFSANPDLALRAETEQKKKIVNA